MGGDLVVSSPGFEGDGPEDDLMVQRCKRRSDERTDPEDPLDRRGSQECKAKWDSDQVWSGIRWNVMVEKGRERSACDDPANHLIVPCPVSVVDDGSSEASGGIDASPGDRDRGKMDQKHRKPDGKRS